MLPTKNPWPPNRELLNRGPKVTAGHDAKRYKMLWCSIRGCERFHAPRTPKLVVVTTPRTPRLPPTPGLRRVLCARAGAHLYTVGTLATAEPAQLAVRCSRGTLVWSRGKGPHSCMRTHLPCPHRRCQPRPTHCLTWRNGLIDQCPQPLHAFSCCPCSMEPALVALAAGAAVSVAGWLVWRFATADADLNLLLK